MNEAELIDELGAISAKLSSYSEMLSGVSVGMAYSIGGIAERLGRICGRISDEGCYTGFDWIALKDALSETRPDLASQIDRYLEGGKG